ncbi:sodium-dependent proline transporter-like [Gigantopelta aegis]|uniref:sodium-dependent proline transporter-like n=1 Tax=Gigantopelta aegis TaxID=1735272 RepID=UPI001B8889AB|nr:sodium-dependent proline transporter-like [Gigantopelta aegis]
MPGLVISEQDGAKARENWGTKIDFLLSCLGYAVGLGNVWRFPYMCYINGGGAFFVPYSIMLFFVGIPIFFIEVSLGQFSSNGPVTCWKFANLFRGLGLGMVLVSATGAIYYNMIIGWAFFYLFASFTTDLPWMKCRPEWSSPMCLTNLPTLNESHCVHLGYSVERNGTCYANGTLRALYDETLARHNNIRKILPTQEYLSNVAFGKNCTAGFSGVGSFRWELILCYLLGWVVVGLSLSNSLKTYTKVVYFTATFPYFVLLILLIRGLMLPGHREGISYYLTPDFSKLAKAKVWKDAAQQIFFSIDASWGGLIALASYNKFKNDIFRDTLFVTLGNCFTSVFAGFVVFTYLGFLAQELNVPISEVVEKGPALVFVVYPFAVTMLPAPVIWSILFFFMLILLGLDTQLVLVETCVTSLVDVVPYLRPFKGRVAMGMCALFFVMGLTLATEGGVCILRVMDDFGGGWNIFIIATIECFAIVHIYGLQRFLMDIESMTGKRVCGFCGWSLVQYWFKACWSFVTPVLLVFTMVFSWTNYERMKGFPDWAEVMGWLIAFSVIVAIFIPAIYLLCTSRGTLRERIRFGLTPTVDWGPALIEHRRLVAEYVPGFVIDPRKHIELETTTNKQNITESANLITEVSAEQPPTDAPNEQGK